MEISVTYAVGPAQASAAVAGLRKFEGIRVVVGLVASLLGTVLCFSIGETAGAVGGIICLFIAVVMAALSANWLRIAARVGRTASASSRLGTVTISDAGLSVARAGSPVTPIEWKDVVHCTNVAGTWVFAVKGRRDAVLIPHRALIPEQREQLTTLLGTWSKRRYRNINR